MYRHSLPTCLSTDRHTLVRSTLLPLLSRYVSPRVRAQRTLELLNLGCRDRLPWQEQQQTKPLDIRTDAKVQIEDGIKEWDYGDYEGLTSATIKEQRSKNGEGLWDIWRDGCPGGEYVRMFYRGSVRKLTSHCQITCRSYATTRQSD